jgi:hypothetical protein
LSRDLHLKRYIVEPGAKVRLSRIDPGDTSGFKGIKAAEKGQSIQS